MAVIKKTGVTMVVIKKTGVTMAVIKWWLELPPVPFTTYKALKFESCPCHSVFDTTCVFKFVYDLWMLRCHKTTLKQM